MNKQEKLENLRKVLRRNDLKVVVGIQSTNEIECAAGPYISNGRMKEMIRNCNHILMKEVADVYASSLDDYANEVDRYADLADEVLDVLIANVDRLVESYVNIDEEEEVE